MILFFTLSSASFADTVYLKDGQVVQGDIYKYTKYSVKIMVNGLPQVFYADEIDRVEYDEGKS
jgi:sRNA-binding regulator protein Hfq